MYLDYGVEGKVLGLGKQVVGRHFWPYNSTSAVVRERIRISICYKAEVVLW